MKRRGQWPFLLPAVALAVLAWWWFGRGDALPPRTQVVVASPSDTPASPALADASAATQGPATLPPARPVVADPLGAAPDLKRVFDEYSASADARDRKVAARAFGACVPAFLPAEGQTPSPEPLIRALPQENRGARETAYWTLFARCRNFLGDGRGALEGVLRDLKGSPDAQEPGVRAQEDLLAGRTDRIDALLAQGLVATDPAAIAAMSGVAVALAAQRNADGSDGELALRARAVDAALPLVACDLGLDCGAASLAALQLCAAQGACEGDLAARFSQRSGDVDAARVQQERTRLLALIRAGRPVGAADLLP